MEETGYEVICGAPMAPAVKGQDIIGEGEDTLAHYLSTSQLVNESIDQSLFSESVSVCSVNSANV